MTDAPKIENVRIIRNGTIPLNTTTIKNCNEKEKNRRMAKIKDYTFSTNKKRDKLR